MDSKKSSSRKASSRRTSKSAAKRPSKKNQGLFKKKIIKPKVKLDSERVLKLCIVIIIACILLLLATLLIPDGTINSESSQRKPDTEQTESTKKENSISKNSTKQNSKKKENIKSDEQKKLDEENRKAEEQKKHEEEQKILEQKKRDEEAKFKEQKEKQKLEAEAKKREEEKRKQGELKKAEEAKAKEFNFVPAVNKAQVVFLLDDGGQNLSQLDKFLSLDMPLTVAVLPGLAHSKEAGQKVRASGKEVILHQPMQAINTSVNPGPGAIKPEMTESEIKSVLYQNITEVGPVSGMNNHEGSLITADAQKMEVILKFASDNGMYFLDSRTNKDTQVPFVSGALGLSYYERNGLFLDNEKTRENALAEIKKNLDKANKDGYVIMIGHVWSASFLPDLLRDIYPELKKKGYIVTTVSNCRGKK